MNRILLLLFAFVLAAPTAWADVAIEKDDTFPSTTSISTKHENQGPWRIVMLDRDEDVITATFYITSVKPMAFDKTKNGVFTIDGVNLPAKLVSSKKTVMTDYSLAAGQFDLSPLKDKFIGAKNIIVTCFFNTGQVVTWEVSPEVVEEWRVVFLLPDGGMPLKSKEKIPATKPGAAKPEPPKAGAPAKPAAKPTPPAATAPAQPAAKSPAPPTTPAGQQPPKESPTPSPTPSPATPTATPTPTPTPAPTPAAPVQQEKLQPAAPVKQAPAEPTKPVQPTPTPAPAATQQQPAAPAAPSAAGPPKPAATAPVEKTETPLKTTPAAVAPSAPPAPEKAVPAAPPPPRPLWQPHAPQPTPAVKQPQTEPGAPASGGIQSFEEDDNAPSSATPDKTVQKPELAKPAPTGETK